MEDHPGAEIIIGSCLSQNSVEEVMDEVEQISGQRPKFFDMALGFAGLEAVLSLNPGGLGTSAMNRTQKQEEHHAEG